MFRRVPVLVAVVVGMMMAVTIGKERKEETSRTAEKYLRDQIHQQARAVCGVTQYQCNSGGCISVDQLCDTHYDCYSSDDEHNCPANCTGEHTFECEDLTKCISISQRCDGHKDCADYSDESFCSNFDCPAGRFKCATTNECIRPSFVCDRYKDCEDGSDEHNCHNGSCSTTQWECADASKCIPRSFLCDGESDCVDRSDELSCSCTAGHFICDNAVCVPSSYKCDGDNDCGDMSDETNCPAFPGNVCDDMMTYEDCFHMNETTHPICLIHDDADRLCRKFCGLCI